ncbi:MAG: KH domain-containing protein [Chloroflexi bacterium]|nr:KH domain-containing protein [Chloroflexota bacterium]MCY3939276.1 KH domain-containing protein [Chloroflexota bacterium]
MDELIEFIARHLVTDRGAVRVTRRDRGRVTIYELEVDQRDMGRVIGRQGRMATAIRTVMRAAPIGQGKRCQLEIVEAG